MRLVLACLIGVALAAPAQGASPRALVSWGKAGVSFAQYRNDAVQCGRKGYYRDVSGTEAAQVFKRATRQLDSNEAGMQTAALVGETDRLMSIIGQSARIVEGTRPELRMREVRTVLNDTVATCLTARGYVRFGLTEAQRRRLNHLRRGTPARHEFLYGLGSDPKVLAAQAV